MALDSNKIADNFIDQIKQGSSPIPKQDNTVIVNDDSDPSAVGGLAALGATVIGATALGRRIPGIKSFLRPFGKTPKTNTTYTPNKAVEEIGDIPTATGQSSELILAPGKELAKVGRSRIGEVQNIPFTQGKGYKDTKDQLWLFRPKDNYERLKKSCVRMNIPVLPAEYFFNGLEKLVFLENKWISNKPGASLYIRPFVFSSSKMLAASPSLDYKFLIICSPGAAYYSKSLSVYVEDKYSRAAPGGAGYAKAAGNYGAAFYPTSLAISKGFDQIVWTDSESHQKIEEVGTMSILFRLGDKLVTPKIGYIFNRPRFSLL